MAVHGTTLEHHAITETALGAATPPSASTGIALESLVLKPNREFIDITDMQRTADKIGWIPGKISGEFSASMQLRLGPTVTALPNQNVILRSIFGTAPIVGASSVTYNHNTFAQAVLPFTLIQQGGQMIESVRPEYFVHQAKGCVVTKATFTVEGGKPTMLEVEGQFQDYDHMFGAPRVGGVVSAGNATVPLQPGDYRKFKTSGSGLYVQLGTNDNAGVGYRAVLNRDVNTLTIAGGLTGDDVSAGALIQPFFPAGVTYTGPHLDGVTNQFTLDDGVNPVTEHGFIKVAVTCETGYFLMNKQATSSVAHRIGQTKRMWSGELTFYYENEMAILEGDAYYGVNYAAELRLGGNTPGSRYRMLFPAFRFDTIDEFVMENDDEGTEVIATFHARRTAGENSCRLIQD